MGPLDLVVLAAYLVATVWLGVRANPPPGGSGPMTTCWRAAR